MNSVNTKLISSTEAEYTFAYKVDAIDSQIIKWADFTIPGVYTGESLPTNAFSATDGIVVKSVTWTPNDAKADASKEYTVKIEFDKKDEFIYADDFEDQGVVSINGESAKLFFNCLRLLINNDLATAKKSFSLSGAGFNSLCTNRTTVELTFGCG